MDRRPAANSIMDRIKKPERILNRRLIGQMWGQPPYLVLFYVEITFSGLPPLFSLMSLRIIPLILSMSPLFAGNILSQFTKNISRIIAVMMWKIK
jgi:hypothetical protein